MPRVLYFARKGNYPLVVLLTYSKPHQISQDSLKVLGIYASILTIF